MIRSCPQWSKTAKDWVLGFITHSVVQGATFVVQGGERGRAPPRPESSRPDSRGGSIEDMARGQDGPGAPDK